MEQPCTLNYPYTSIDFQKIAYLTHCLQIPANTYASHVFGRGQIQGSNEVFLEDGTNTLLKVLSLT